MNRFIRNIYHHLVSYLSSISDEDKRLFDTFVSDLSANESVQYVRDLSGTSWDSDSFFRNLDEVFYKWVGDYGNVEFEFVDIRMEKRRDRFFGVLREYISYAAANTFPQEGRRNLSEIAHEWRGVDSDSEHFSNKFDEARDTLWAKGAAVGKEYDDFVRYCKRRLVKDKISKIKVASISSLMVCILGLGMVWYNDYSLSSIQIFGVSFSEKTNSTTDIDYTMENDAARLAKAIVITGWEDSGVLLGYLSQITSFYERYGDLYPQEYATYDKQLEIWENKLKDSPSEFKGLSGLVTSAERQLEEISSTKGNHNW